jgi:hypothetical protein
MNACDIFVVLDDAQYIQRGWVNRNRILHDESWRWITLPVAAADHRLPINERRYLLTHRLARRLPDRLAAAYRRAPFLRDAIACVETVLSEAQDNVAEVNIALLRGISKQLGITTPIVLASKVPLPHRLTGQERVVAICEALGASTYINPMGGVDLYDAARFARSGIELAFLQSCASAYRQFGGPFVACLSVLDVMMFNDTNAIRRMLREYQLLRRPAAPRTLIGVRSSRHATGSSSS